MSLPIAASDRQPKHRRSIDVRVYARGNGLWEVDARIADTRPTVTRMATGLLPAGEPIHDMLLRLVVDERFNVIEAGAQTFSMPYPGECDAYGDVYSRLVGLNLMRGFRAAVKQRLGGVQACTHLTELSQVVPTAVVQAFAGEVLDVRGSDPDVKPFQIDGCHALRADGPTVATFYPRWHRPEPAGADHATEGNASQPDVPRSPAPEL